MSENDELLRAYRLAFNSPAGMAVMADLAPFCRAAETCFHPDPRLHANLEGRREVWLRIQKFIHLDEPAILQFAQRRVPQPAEKLGDTDG